MSVEHIDRIAWHTLSDTDQGAWEQRLLDQWNVPLKESYDMWVDGEEVIAVRRWKRDGEGRRVHILETLGQVPEHEELKEKLEEIRLELVQLRRLLVSETSNSVKDHAAQ